jgi:effector-binding domain-containing protein
MGDSLIEVVETAAQPALFVRTVTPVGNLPQELGKAFTAIMQYLGELGEQPANAPFTAYYNMDMEHLEVEIGFPVTKALPARGDIAAGEIPAGKKVTRMYKGPYMGMEPVYAEIAQYMEENGLEPTGVVYEFYYNSPCEVSESELLTKIVFLLK